MMHTVNTLTYKIPKPVVSIEKIREIFAMSSRIADDAESVLEDNRAFSSDFQRGLNASLSDARKGKVRKVASLGKIVSRTAR